MLKNVAHHLRCIVAFLEAPEGDVKQKFYSDPKIKPPRRNPSVVNKSNRSDYSKNYMKEYREQGKDYQRKPESFKKWRREQRKRLKEKLKAQNPLKAHLIDQEVTMWHQLGKPVDHQEFEFICTRRGFDEEDRIILAEDLCDLGLILY